MQPRQATSERNPKEDEHPNPSAQDQSAILPNTSADHPNAHHPGAFHLAATHPSARLS
jgi:hypothetical protein